MNRKIKIGSLTTAIGCSKRTLSFFNNDPKRLEELAKKDIIPHSRLTFPDSEEVIYLFSTTKINNYLNQNCITEIEGKKLTVIDFNKENYPVQQIDSLPKELQSNANVVYSLPLAYLNSPSGIYFLYLDDELIYIGQSINIGNRIVGHHKSKNKVFNKVFFIRVDEPSLDEVEIDLIRHFKPKCNKIHYKRKRVQF